MTAVNGAAHPIMTLAQYAIAIAKQNSSKASTTRNRKHQHLDEFYKPLNKPFQKLKEDFIMRIWEPYRL